MDFQEIKDSVAQLDVDALVKEFNALVGKNAWTGARAAHDTALIDALVNKGIDVSAIYDGSTISFKRKIVLNKDKTKVILSE